MGRVEQRGAQHVGTRGEAAQMVGRNSDHMDWGDDGSWWMVGMMIIFGLAIIGVLVWAVVMTSRSHASAPGVQAAGCDAVVAVHGA